MVSPYAAGLGGFMNGFAGGMSIGEKLKKRFDEHAAQQEREAAIADGRQKYQQQVQQQASAIEDLQQPVQPTYQNETVSVTPVQERKVEAQGLPTLDGSAPPDATRPMQSASIGAGGGQQVAEKVIETPATDQKGAASTRQETMKIAQGQVGSEREAIDKAISSRMSNFYMDRGDVAMADKWDQYAESQQGKKYIKQFGKALRSAAIGDTAGTIKNLTPILNEYYGDGFKIQGSSAVKDKDGNVTGYNYKVRNTRTGESTDHTLDNDGVNRILTTIGTPQQGFERHLKKTQEGQRDARQHEKNLERDTRQHEKNLERDTRQHEKNLERDARQHENNLERDAQAGNLRANEPGQLSKKVADLRRENVPEEKIQAMLANTAVTEEAFKKGAAPEEAHRMLMTNFASKYVDMSGKPTMGVKEMSDMADKMIEASYGVSMANVRNSKKGGAAPAGTTPNPAAAGLGGAGKPFFDQTTGKVVYFGADGKPIR